MAIAKARTPEADIRIGDMFNLPFEDNSFDFCQRLLEEAGVAATPGIDFGAYQAEQFVRFAYTTGDEDIELGLERLARALRDWSGG